MAQASKSSGGQRGLRRKPDGDMPQDLLSGAVEIERKQSAGRAVDGRFEIVHNKDIARQERRGFGGATGNQFKNQQAGATVAQTNGTHHHSEASRIRGAIEERLHRAAGYGE